MTTDVAEKAISGNPINNNNVTILVAANTAKILTKDNGDNNYITVTDLETKLTERFNDRLYYSN